MKWFLTSFSIFYRLNRSLKCELYMNFTLKATSNSVDHIQDIVLKLNTRYHRTIKMSPMDAYLPKNQLKLKKIYKLNNTRKLGKPKFKIGDHVRISRQDDVFTKKYLHRFSPEIFYIHKVCRTQFAHFFFHQHLMFLISCACR